MLQREDKSKLVQSSWMRFNSNMGALHSFFENLTKFADEADKLKVKKFAEELAHIFKDKLEIVEKDISKFIPSVDDWDVYPDFRNDESVREMISTIKDEEFKNIASEWDQSHPFKSQRLVRIFSTAFNDPPVSGVLLRRSMLVSLVTFLEIFLEDTYKNHYLCLGQSKVEAEKAANALMKGNWRDQKIANLQRIGLNFSAISKYSNEIFEIAQRRHLIVHNDGIVDENYNKYIPNRYNIGDHLLVSTQYFQRAINTIHTFGFLLFYNQLAHHEDNKQIQYHKLDEFILNSLRMKRYGLIIDLSENADDLDLPEHKQQIFLVNRAIAFRELGKMEEVNILIDSLENRQPDWQIDLAISMLRNDITTLKRQMLQLPNTPDIAKISQWPLFDPVKDQIWFKAALMKKSKVRLSSRTKQHKRR